MEGHFAQILACSTDQPRQAFWTTRAQSEQNKTNSGSRRRGKRRAINRGERPLRSAESPSGFPARAAPPPLRTLLSSPALDPHPGGSTPGLPEEVALGSAVGPAGWCFSPLEILCHFPTGHFPSGPPSTGPGFSSHQSPRSAVISVPHSHGSSSITHHPPDPRPRAGRARKPSSPGTYTWPQRVRTGWCNTSRHTEQSKDVTGSSGSPRRSRARGVAEAGADFPLSLLSTEPIPAPPAPDGRQKLGACGRLVLLSCGGGRKSRPSCDRRLPARPAAQPGSSLGRGAQPGSKAGRVRGRFRSEPPSARCPSLGWEAAAAGRTVHARRPRALED